MSRATGRIKERFFAALAFLLPAAGLGLAGAATLGWRFAWVLPATLAACELAVRGARFVARPGWPVFGMAGGVLDEAVARGFARWAGFVLCLALAVAAALTRDERLDYWEKSFLSWGLLAVELVVCVLTLALAALSVSSEYRGKQIHTNLAKPVGRLAYLGGKWLGLALFNLALLAATAGAVACCAKAIESRWSAETALQGEAKNAEVEACRRTVLASRFLTTPAMENPDALNGYFLERLGIMASSGSLEAQAAVEKMLADAKAAGGRPPAYETFRPVLSRREFANCLELATGKWYTLGHPDDAANAEPTQVYVFSGLFAPMERAKAAHDRVVAELMARGLSREEAEAFIPVLLRRSIEVPAEVKRWASDWVTKRPAEYEAATAAWAAQLQAERLQLSLMPNAGGPTPREGVVELRVEANGWPAVPAPAERAALRKAGLAPAAVMRGHRLLPAGQTTSLDIPAERIDAQGRLAVRLTRVLVNGAAAQPTILFDTATYGAPPSPGGIRLYGPAGSFIGNVGVAMAVLWIKTGFLAMLGLVAGCLFTFPVACLLAVALYALAAFSGGLRESFSDFTTLGLKPTSGVDWWLMQVKTLTRVAMLSVLRVAPDFGAYDARAQVADGAEAGWAMLGRCAAVLGLVWTGATALLGWFLFERREIARVIV